MLVSSEMITGFNTDVPHEGHVYHVQTEDGGAGHPILESLVNRAIESNYDLKIAEARIREARGFRRARR